MKRSALDSVDHLSNEIVQVSLVPWDRERFWSPMVMALDFCAVCTNVYYPQEVLNIFRTSYRWWHASMVYKRTRYSMMSNWFFDKSPAPFSCDKEEMD